MTWFAPPFHCTHASMVTLSVTADMGAPNVAWLLLPLKFNTTGVHEVCAAKIAGFPTHTGSGVTTNDATGIAFTVAVVLAAIKPVHPLGLV